MTIQTISNKSEEKILRTQCAAFDFEKFSKKEVKELVTTMREIMVTAHGIGLAANQIGLNTSVFVAKPPEGKFYAIFNPEIIKTSGEVVPLEEGCLSVPGQYGMVPRFEKLMLKGQDQNGRKIKIKATGLLAHIFQHETDHLNGILYIDKASSIRNYENERTYEKK